MAGISRSRGAATLGGAMRNRRWIVITAGLAELSPGLRQPTAPGRAETHGAGRRSDAPRACRSADGVGDQDRSVVAAGDSDLLDPERRNIAA